MEIARQLPAQLRGLTGSAMPSASAGCRGLTACSYFTPNLGDSALARNLPLPACRGSGRRFPSCPRKLGHHHEQRTDTPGVGGAMRQAINKVDEVLKNSNSL